MKKLQNKPLILSLIIFIFVLCVGTLIIIFVNKPMPFTLIQSYGAGTLWEEARVMNECAECHNPADFHNYMTCHDDHGAVELEGIRFFEVIELTGDVPESAFVRINEILPEQDNLGTHILLSDFLSNHGIESFESITFTTNDGGLTTIESQYLDDTAMLVPYMGGI